MQTLEKKLKAEQVIRIRNLFSEELLLSASVLFLPVLYMTAAFALLSDIGLGRWVFLVGLSLWGIAVVALHREEKWQKLAITLLLFLAIFALAAFLTRFVLDWKYDSRAYHAQAVLALLKGVNPYWDSADWTTYTYPAAHWLLSSSFILWTQTFEASFAFTLEAVFAAFLCARRFLTTLPTLPRVWRNLFAFLLAANPVAAFCFFNHHVDGLLASTLLSVFMLMLCFVCDGGSRQADKRRMRRTAFCIAALLVLLVNIKFTGLVFGGVLGLTALAYGGRCGAARKTLLRLAGLGSATAILGVALFGFYPYMTNVRQHANPVHPMYPAIVFGEKVSQQRQPWFLETKNPILLGKSSYEQWWVSLFSKQGETFWTPAPLPPFSSLYPLSFLYGFGSLFSGSLLLCLSLAFFVRHRGAGVVLAGVMASILLTEASVSPRLTPQSWWLPILFLVFLLAPDERQHPLSRAQRSVIFVVTACLLYTSVLSFGGYGERAVSLLQTVRQAERQGGWFVVPDKSIPDWDKKTFLDYYKSDLTNVRLPLREDCSDQAEQRRLAYGLVLCKP